MNYYSFLKPQFKGRLCLEAFLGPPKAIMQPCEMLYLVEVITIISF